MVGTRLLTQASFSVGVLGLIIASHYAFRAQWSTKLNSWNDFPNKNIPMLIDFSSICIVSKSTCSNQLHNPGPKSDSFIKSLCIIPSDDDLNFLETCESNHRLEIRECIKDEIVIPASSCVQDSLKKIVHDHVSTLLDSTSFRPMELIIDIILAVDDNKISERQSRIFKTVSQSLQHNIYFLNEILPISINIRRIMNLNWAFRYDKSTNTSYLTQRDFNTNSHYFKLISSSDADTCITCHKLSFTLYFPPDNSNSRHFIVTSESNKKRLLNRQQELDGSTIPSSLPSSASTLNTRPTPQHLVTGLSLADKACLVVANSNDFKSDKPEHQDDIQDVTNTIIELFLTQTRKIFGIANIRASNDDHIRTSDTGMSAPRIVDMNQNDGTLLTLWERHVIQEAYWRWMVSDVNKLANAIRDSVQISDRSVVPSKAFIDDFNALSRSWLLLTQNISMLGAGEYLYRGDALTGETQGLQYYKSLFGIHQKLSRLLYHPSLVGTPFVPLQNRIAIFAPYWIPIAVPLVHGLMHELLRVRLKLSEKRTIG